MAEALLLALALAAAPAVTRVELPNGVVVLLAPDATAAGVGVAAASRDVDAAGGRVVVAAEGEPTAALLEGLAPPRTVVAIAGAFDVPKLRALAEQSLGPIPRDRPAAAPKRRLVIAWRTARATPRQREVLPVAAEVLARELRRRLVDDAKLARAATVEARASHVALVLEPADGVPVSKLEAAALEATDRYLMQKLAPREIEAAIATKRHEHEALAASPSGRARRLALAEVGVPTALPLLDVGSDDVSQTLRPLVLGDEPDVVLR